jgi:hypothetical protein
MLDEFRLDPSTLDAVARLVGRRAAVRAVAPKL